MFGTGADTSIVTSGQPRASFGPLQVGLASKAHVRSNLLEQSSHKSPMCDGIDLVKAERNKMRKALLAVAGAALMGAVLVAPACGEPIADYSEAIRLDPKNTIAYG